MKIQFWGVRGSIPTPGQQTLQYGGNTPCVSISLDRSHTLVLDAGTGLFRLGQAKVPGAHTYLFLLSHVHWDHIQGFPMFRPHMNPEVTIRIFSEMNPSWSDILLSQLDGIRFPITVDELRADVAAINTDPNLVLSRFDVSLSRIRLNHRGECYGYRITTPTASICYITDHEMDAVENVYTSFEELAAFCEDASILIHDTHFLQEQIPEKTGLGHTSVERACELAAAARVGQLILYHHAPERTDEMLDANVVLAQARLKELNTAASCVAAREGLVLEL